MNDKDIAVRRHGSRQRKSRFQQLWSLVEAMVEENAQLESALDRLVLRLVADVLPAEEALAEVCRQALARLLWFSERKTLGKKRRVALTPWIDEMLRNLLDISDVDDALRKRLARHHAAVLNVPLDPDSGESEWCQLEAWLEQQQSQRVCGQWAWPDSAQGFDDGRDRADGPVALDPVEQEGQDRVCKAHVPPESIDLDDTAFKRLFRQTAAALHPDKEADEHKRRRKHVLMTRLLQARRDHDLIALLQLHGQHAGKQCVLSDADERQLEGALIQHLRVLNERKLALAEKSFLHHQAYHRFHDEDETVVDARLVEHIRCVRQRQSDYLAFLDDVVTLAQLRERLQPGQPWLSQLW